MNREAAGAIGGIIGAFGVSATRIDLAARIRDELVPLFARGSEPQGAA